MTSQLPRGRQDAPDGIELYRGKIVQVDGSWARITRIGSEVSGLVFDGVEYFAIDSVANVADMLRMQGEAGGTVIYRLHDTVGLIHDDMLESGSLTGIAAVAPQRNASSLKSGVVLGLQIDIGVVGDFEFTQLVGGSKAAEAMIRLINAVDGIFLEGLGIHIKLVELQAYDAEPDPFTSADPIVLLAQLADLKYASAAFRPLGLLHLFTGRDLENISSSGQTLGVANVGTVCDPKFGVALTKSSGSTVDAVVAAHEIGHNFGAPHDAEPGSACAAAPAGLLMDASFNGSTQFSQCSIDIIKNKAANSTCLTPLLPADMTLRLLSDAPPPVVAPDVGYTFDIVLENTSGSDAVDVKLTLDAPSMDVFFTRPHGAAADYCETNAIDQPAKCYWSAFANGERFGAALGFRARSPGHATIDVNVTSLTESDVTGDSLHFEVDVLPYVDLAASLDPPALSLRLDEPGSVTATLKNIGTEPAHDVIARVQVGQKLELIDASIGPCHLGSDIDLIAYDCPVGTLAPRESVDFVVNFRPRADLPANAIKDGANIGILASSLEPERTGDRHDNAFWTTITLGDSIGDLVIAQSARARVFLGDPIYVLVDVRNDGPDTIHDIVLDLSELSGSANAAFTQMTTSGGSCQLPLSSGDRICEIPQLAPGEEVNLTFLVTASSTGDIRLYFSSGMSSSDPNTSNNSAVTSITVAPQPPAPAPSPPPSPSPQASTAGGGGGVLDPLALFFLSLLGIFAIVRAHFSHA